MKKVFPVLLVLVAFLALSCSHIHSPYQEEYFFQALGENGELVLTADVEKLRGGELGTLLPEDDSVINRTERVNLSLLPEDETLYPSPMENFVLSGALEGNFPKILSNMSLSQNSDFQKVKDLKPKRFAGNGLVLGVPQSGIVIFTNGDYDEFLSRSIENREKRIPDDIAAKMASSSVAFYSRSPKTLMDIGFSLPQVVLETIEETYLMFDEGEEGFVLNGVLALDSESGARALNTLLKNQYIQSVKRSGEKLDTKKAAGYFTYQEESVLIDGFVLTNAMNENTMALLEKTLGGIV